MPNFYRARFSVKYGDSNQSYTWRIEFNPGVEVNRAQVLQYMDDRMIQFNLDHAKYKINSYKLISLNKIKFNAHKQSNSSRPRKV